MKTELALQHLIRFVSDIDLMENIGAMKKVALVLDIFSKNIHLPSYSPRLGQSKRIVGEIVEQSSKL